VVNLKSEMILVSKEDIGKRSAKPLTQGIQHAGFQGNWQDQSPPAKSVTGDNESVTNSRTLHTLNVMAKYKKGEILIYAWIYELG
jgi:hypothetical protein